MSPQPTTGRRRHQQSWWHLFQVEETRSVPMGPYILYAAICEYCGTVVATLNSWHQTPQSQWFRKQSAQEHSVKRQQQLPRMTGKLQIYHCWHPSNNCFTYAHDWATPWQIHTHKGMNCILSKAYEQTASLKSWCKHLLAIWPLQTKMCVIIFYWGSVGLPFLLTCLFLNSFSLIPFPWLKKKRQWWRNQHLQNSACCGIPSLHSSG